jgi:antirestriction protein ArdC
VDQCQGINPSVLTSSFERENDPIKACEIVINNFHERPGIEETKDVAGYYHMEDMIYMPPIKSFDSSESYYTTLFHELVHSTGHERRLNRKTLTEMVEFGSEPYSIEELVAELGQCFLSSHTGILEKEFKNSAAYIQGWLKKLKNDKRFVMIASTQAQKASDYILSGRKKEHEEFAAEAAVSK